MVKPPKSETNEFLTFGLDSNKWKKASTKLSQELLEPVKDYSRACSLVKTIELSEYLGGKCNIEDFFGKRAPNS